MRKDGREAPGSTTGKWTGPVHFYGTAVEPHDAPEKALSDGSNALRINLLPAFWEKLKAIHAVVG
jgi:3-deoxy-D-manno-octulosonic acid (KDO) 8-phosphate synthase